MFSLQLPNVKKIVMNSMVVTHRWNIDLIALQNPNEHKFFSMKSYRGILFREDSHQGITYAPKISIESFVCRGNIQVKTPVTNRI